MIGRGGRTSDAGPGTAGVIVEVTQLGYFGIESSRVDDWRAYGGLFLGMQPVENSLIAALTPNRWRSTSYAIKFILNFGVGSTAVYLIAPVKKAYSLEAVYIFLSGVTLLLVLGIVVLVVASRNVASIRN